MTAVQPRSPSRPVRILSVDDHQVVFNGLKAGLGTEPDLQVVGWRRSADDLLASVDAENADIVLIDIDMPGPDAFAAIEELRRLRPTTRAIVLSAFTRDNYIDSAITAGAWGYLSKNDDFEGLIDGVRRVARGEFAFSQAALQRCEFVNGRLRPKRIADDARADADGGASRLNTLTTQEMQVLRLIARGSSTREVAQAIHRSEKRVEAIRTSILRKLGCSDRVELTRYAIREGLVEP